MIPAVLFVLASCLYLVVALFAPHAAIGLMVAYVQVAAILLILHREEMRHHD